MRSRKRGLEAFYGGPVWKTHAAAANATMIDVDNVLLLQPLSGLELNADRRAAPESTALPPGLLATTIYPLSTATAAAFPRFFSRELEPALRQTGCSVVATYVTEHSENTFPALPVRAAEVFVWMAMYTDEADHAEHIAALQQLPAGATAYRTSGLTLSRRLGDVLCVAESTMSAPLRRSKEEKCPSP